MKRPFPPARHAGNRAAFTLIELLIVIAIIAILAGILLSVFGAVQNRGRKVQAANDLRNSLVAITSYYTDYQKYPLNDVQQEAVANGAGDTEYGDPGGTYSSADLFDILRAVADTSHNANNVLNPNQVVYWAGKFASSAAQPREGITPQDVTVNGNKIPHGSLVDPWGNSYVFYIDANKDGDLSAIIAHQYSDAGTVALGAPPVGIAACSMGADGVFGTKVGGAGNGLLKGSDDVVTWQ